MDTLTKILYQIRLHNLTDKAFEDHLGLKPKTVDSWKRGNSASYHKYISRIADFFGVSLDYLMRDNENSETFILSGSELKKCRMSNKLKPDEIAKQLGVTVTEYSAWERGVASINSKQLTKLSQLLKTDKNTLLTKQQPLTTSASMMEKPALPEQKDPKTILLRCTNNPSSMISENVCELNQDEYEFLQDILQKILKAR